MMHTPRRETQAASEFLTSHPGPMKTEPMNSTPHRSPLRHWQTLLPLTVAALALTLTHCGTSTAPTTSTPTAASGTFTNVYTTVLQTACIECHVPGGAATVNNGVTLDFTTQQTAYTTLTTNTVSATDTKTECAGVKIVVPGNANSSYLAAVLFSDIDTANFGGVTGCTPYNVHQQDQSISASERTSILAWINGGALNN